MKVWPNTDLFCGGSHGIPLNERLHVVRPYGRVDRAVSHLAVRLEVDDVIRVYHLNANHRFPTL